MGHTPEPWKVIGSGQMNSIFIESAAEGLGHKAVAVARCQGMHAAWLEMSEEDAHRAADCVNACKDINPESVPALLSALEDCLEEIEFEISNDSEGEDGPVCLIRARDTAQAAIALAKGEA